MTKIITRNDTTTNWESTNPILALGEIGIDTTLKQFKIGDGTSTWNNLSYAGGGSSSELDAYIEGISNDNNITLTPVDGKALILDAPMIAVGENLVNEINGENTQLYLKQGDIEGDGIVVTKTATGVKLGADLSGKEDELTAITPIYKSQRSQSPLAGFNYTTDNTGIYSSNSWGTSVLQSTSGNTGIIDIGDATYHNPGNLFPWRPESLESYIAIPYSIGQVLKYPSLNQYAQTVVLGHFDESGIFRPITMLYYGEPFHLIMSDADPEQYTVNTYGAVRARWNCPGYKLEPTSGGGSVSWTISNGGSSAYFQLFKNEDGTIGFGSSSCNKTGGDRFNYYRETWYNTTEMVERVEQITTALLLPLYEQSFNYTYSFGRIASDAFPLSNIGVYDNPGLLGRDITDMSLLGSNRFEIDTPVVANYLGLNIGSGLEVVDGKLQTTPLPIASSTQEGIVQVDGTTITSNDGVISVIGGGSSDSNLGIKGDYSTHYGIVDCPNGILEYTATTKTVTLQPGVVMQLAGADTLTTNASAVTLQLASAVPITLFYAEGNLLEAGKVDYQEDEPTDNGVDNYQAWFKPSLDKWQMKSNDSGNVWREVNATPIANIRFNEAGTVITRVDYIGYRILNDDILVDQTQIDSINDSIETLTTNVNTLGDNVGNCVTLTGNQTVNGDKVFTNEIKISNGGVAHLHSDGTSANLVGYNNTDNIIGVGSSGYNLRLASQNSITTRRSGVDYVNIDSGNISSYISTPTNMVTTNTNQTIEGIKTFNALQVEGSTGIADNNGKTFIHTNVVEDSDGWCWELGSNDSSMFKNVYIKRGPSGSYVNIDSGNIDDYISSSTPSNMVTTNTDQTITGLKTFGEAGIRVSSNDFLGVVQTRNDNGNLVFSAMKNNYTNGRTYTFSSGVNNQEAQIEIGSNIALHTGNAFKQVKLTQAEYDALTTKDENTMYLITE